MGPELWGTLGRVQRWGRTCLAPGGQGTGGQGTGGKSERGLSREAGGSGAGAAWERGRGRTGRVKAGEARRGHSDVTVRSSGWILIETEIIGGFW